MHSAARAADPLDVRVVHLPDAVRERSGGVDDALGRDCPFFSG